MLPTESTILIVGAGPTGLAAAIELARRGYRPRIVSASEGPVHESRALGINQRTLQILGPSGATERLLAAGQIVGGLHLHTAERELLHVPTPRSDGLPFLLILPQSEIEALLVDVLRGYGIEVEWRTALEQLSLEQDRPRAVLSGGEKVSPDLLIGADGAHSTVRRALGLQFAGAAYETEWGLADARVATDLPLQDAHAFDLAPVLFVAIPVRGNLVRFISDHANVLHHVPPQYRVESVEWQSTFRISHRQVDTYQQGRVFLAGDAAHIHSPLGARGMNLGIEDAAWLAWMISERTTARYTAERKPAGRRVLRIVDPATRLMSSDALLAKLVRRQVLPRILNIEPVRRRLIDRILSGTAPPPWLTGSNESGTVAE